MIALAVLLQALAQQPSPVDGPFTVCAEPATVERPARVSIAADQKSIDCLDALRRLAAAMNWNLVIDSRPLEQDLRAARVDLNFADQDPRLVAQLIAIAAGSDVVFDAGEQVPGARPTLHVVRPPDANTESGRQRLRAMAVQWYRSFLVDELKREPLVEAAAPQVRMHLGRLLVDSGDLAAAIPVFTQIYEQRPHALVPAAVLRLATCHLDLGASLRERDAARAEFQKAEQWARRLLESQPSAPEAASATVALGRALLGQASNEPDPTQARTRIEQCRAELSARVLRLRESNELLEVWLLVGEAQFRLERPAGVYETMLTLRESAGFRDLDQRQFRDYHFLLGYGAAGQGKHELGMRALEWFLIHAEDDPRRGMAYVLLGENYIAQDRYVQARAAAVEARARHMADLSPAWRRRALQLWSRTALALGDKQQAFDELELLVLREDDPDLILFLVDQMLADRQWQRAISVARLLSARDGAFGDGARFRTLQALHQQAVASGSLDDFPAQATELIPRIQDTALRRRAVELLGDAYSRLGRLEHAADAYRGILR